MAKKKRKLKDLRKINIDNSNNTGIGYIKFSKPSSTAKVVVEYIY